MTEKQYRKADSMVLPIAFVIMFGIFLNVAGLAISRGVTVQYMITIIGCIVGILATVITFFVARGKKCCGWLMTLITAVAYIVMVFNIDAIYFYFLVAAVLVMSMSYLELKRTVICAVITIPAVIIKAVILMNKGSIMAIEAGTTIVILLFVVISIFIVTRLWIHFNKENIENVEAGAEKQKEAADRMAHVSENIVSYFDQAGIYIKELSNEINTSNFSMQNIASNVENTAQAIQEQSQMCQDIQENTQNAKAQTEVMVIASGQALEDVKLGAKAMEELHNHAQNVEKNNNETVAHVASLNERADKVANILSTIVNISSQTNLLALNASIEAARAGEAGKGFAVVADEIRVLSEQTKTATENITDILNELNEDVDSVTMSINHSVDAVGQQNQLIEETKSKFDAIDNGVNELMSVITHVKKAIDDIAEAAGVIADGITGLSANSQEVAAVSNEGTQLMTKAVDDMNRVNESLTNIYQLAQDLKSE